VLKFIQPQAYPQRISYIRTSDGAMKNVQIKITGTRNEGSQKNL
jgi:VCBS repeat-containing protein